MESIEKETAAYEKWLNRQCEVVKAALVAKHQRMRESKFDFLRATFYRWARTIEGLCPSLATSPSVLCIGDIHVENYGTWRDADSRLVWGINDFDEVAVMPYAFDLVRLATSAVLAPHIDILPQEVTAAILRGYERGLDRPRPALVDEDTLWLRSYVSPTPKSAREFWQEAAGWPKARPPKKVVKALEDALPPGATVQRFATRSIGGGSLGRPRFLVIADWNGGHVVREAKALVPSAWEWAHETNRRSRVLDAAFGPHRSPDPHLRRHAGFVVRRIAPDSRKIDIKDLQLNGLTEDLLAAMGADLAAVHAGSKRTARIADDFRARPSGWLHDATQIVAEATKRDYVAYAALET